MQALPELVQYFWTTFLLYKHINRPYDLNLFVLEYRLNKNRPRYEPDYLTRYSVVHELPPEQRNEFDEKFKQLLAGNSTFTQDQSRALGCMMGMAIGDALGAPLEFSRVQYGITQLTEFTQTEFWENMGWNRFRLKPGQWTDDTSMGLCLAESLIACKGFQPIDLRIRFINWWDYGYRNAFAYDTGRFRSCGLGGTIGSSFTEFEANRSEYTKAGDRKSSGNGSIMRLAPVPIYYASDMTAAMDIAAKQSKTTHQGDEAAECCRLMTYIIVSLINAPQPTANQRKLAVMEDLPAVFQTKPESATPSVDILAASKQEIDEATNSPNPDRNWNWKSPDFRYSPKRANSQPGYIGSYCMDGLSMALHCIWTTNSFKEALTKAINTRGDSDTVGAITGQIAGSLYGIEEVPLEWIQHVQTWDKGDIMFTAWMLFTKQNFE